MDKLDKELGRMSKIEPSKGFIEVSKNRLMQQIVLQQNESWFKSFLRRVGRAEISENFMSQARLRLMHRITGMPRAVKVPLKGIALFLRYTQRVVASTLVMLIAVTSTLFFVEGTTVVEASDDSYLEIITGTASIKHADLIVWEDINNLIEVRAGDLIKVSEGSEVAIHFFDDTELRLAENSIILISQLTVSPTFGRQGIIEASLHEGTAWVQALNVEDGYSGFTLSTRDAILKALNGTFTATAHLGQPTSVFVLRNKIQLTSLIAETRAAINTIRLDANQKATVHAKNGGRPVTVTEELSQQDLANGWFQNNLYRDNEHLTMLRDTEIERLSQMAGTLPGQMLYPIKQTKERLRLAFSSDTDVDVLVDIANRRLNEALVLFEIGEEQKGREALMAYQDIARQIAEVKGEKDVAYKLITPHQKAINAEMSNDASTGLVKEALHQTAEIFEDDPIELEKLRLANSVQRLQDVRMLVEEGDVQAAKDRLASHQLAESDALAAAEAIEDEELRREAMRNILELRQEELTLLTSLSLMLGEANNMTEDLVAMVQSASETAEENVEEILASALALLPELAIVEPEPSAADLKMAELIGKIYIYKTWDGQRNQIERLLKYELTDPDSIDYLIGVRNHLRGRAFDYLNVRILQLQQLADYQKSKTVQRKIQESMELREI